MELLQNILSSFGAAVVVPVMLFIVALFLKVKPKKAFQSALNAGIGLTGFNLIVNSFVPIVTPVINNMVEQTGVKLPVFDRLAGDFGHCVFDASRSSFLSSRFGSASGIILIKMDRCIYAK